MTTILIIAMHQSTWQRNATAQHRTQYIIQIQTTMNTADKSSNQLLTACAGLQKREDDDDDDDLLQ